MNINTIKITNLLDKAQSLGASISVEANSLVFSAKKGTLPADLLEDFKQHKEDVIYFLKNQENSQKLNKYYINNALCKYNLTIDDITGKNDPALKLDEQELNDIRNNKALFDIWVEHVHRHKQLKALELAKKKREEEYDQAVLFSSMPFADKFKLTKHILVTFLKYFKGSDYSEDEPNDLFVEIWFLANADLTIGQVIDDAAELILLADKYKKEGSNAKYERLQTISENAEYFREFCVNKAKGGNIEDIKIPLKNTKTDKTSTAPDALDKNLVQEMPQKSSGLSEEDISYIQTKAKELGVPNKTLDNWISKHGIEHVLQKIKIADSVKDKKHPGAFLYEIIGNS